ncbi:hypothetical protein M9H77_26557 [Catharanthus roseus]|uniref:Uncharacterized protein n=1 Tax=Catharanthus roseus TaxID=4058 RepID=A0ACC0AC63_CATRO|nr:hypothetical protein M9H77_26557 [Catharanthus roseus]
MRTRGLKRRNHQPPQIVVLSSSSSPLRSSTSEKAHVVKDTEIAHGVEAEIDPEVEKETKQQRSPLSQDQSVEEGSSWRSMYESYGFTWPDEE